MCECMVCKSVEEEMPFCPLEKRGTNIRYFYTGVPIPESVISYFTLKCIGIDNPYANVTTRGEIKVSDMISDFLEMSEAEMREEEFVGRKVSFYSDYLIHTESGPSPRIGYSKIARGIFREFFEALIECGTVEISRVSFFYFESDKKNPAYVISRQPAFIAKGRKEEARP